MSLSPNELLVGLSQSYCTIDYIERNYGYYKPSLNSYYISTYENALFLSLRYLKGLAMFKYLFQNGVTLKQHLPNNENILHYAVNYVSDVDTAFGIVKLIHKEYPELLNEKTDAGCTPLDYAIQKNNMVMAYALIAHEVHYQNNLSLKHQQTLLHKACENGFYPLVAALSRKHTDWITMVDAKGDTPIAIAVRNGHTEIAELLLQNAQNNQQFHHFFKLAITGSPTLPREKKANALRELFNFKRYCLPESCEINSIEWHKQRIKLAIMNYFECHNTAEKLYATVGLGCAASERRMKNGAQLLELIDKAYTSVEDLQTAVSYYCENKIETGFFGRSLLRDAVRSANVIESLPSYSKG